MNIRISLMMTALIASAALVPIAGVGAQDSEPAEGPVTLPLNPDNNRFEWDAAHEDVTKNHCNSAIEAEFGKSSTGKKWIYATNNPDDRCRNDGPHSQSANDGSRAAFPNPNAEFEIAVWPPMNNTTVDPTAKVEGQIHFWFENVAHLNPKMELTVGNYSDTWTASEPYQDTDGENPGWTVFRFEFDPLPELVTGTMVITVDVGVSSSADDPGYRAIAGTKYGLGLVPEHQSYIDLPLAEPPAPAPTTFECTDPNTGDNVTFEINATQSSCDDIVFATNDTDVNTSDVDNGTTDADNQTQEDDHGNHTHNETGNETIPGEESLLPGFETVAIVGAIGLLALAGHRIRAPETRRRR